MFFTQLVIMGNRYSSSIFSCTSSSSMERDVHHMAMGCISSSSCLPLSRDHSRFHLLVVDGPSKARRRWRYLLRKLLKQTKALCASSKPQTFCYDLVSYSLNFDNGDWSNNLQAIR